jgi:hypothetical protein
MTQVSYEVSISTRPDLSEAFESFMLDIHIPDVLATGAFTEGRFAMLEPDRYRASYLCVSLEILDNYLREHSPRLRDDVTKHFPDGLSIAREQWNVLASF